MVEVQEVQEFFINLGKLDVIAHIKLNGSNIGGVMMALYRSKATDYIKKGTNKLRMAKIAIVFGEI